MLGVLNVTPDSFSDGGRWADLDAAVGHGLAMAADGADLVDVGGESTRPGADRVDAEEEARRVVPVIRALAAEGVAVSVDTTRAAVAMSALDAGARVVNDVSGGLADPDMAKVVAAAGVPWMLMHWRGHSRDMQALASYGDVVVDVRTELLRQADAALAAGVEPDRIVLDPGLGFAKTAEHNWALLARLGELVAARLPGAGRRVPQVVPRPAARRPGRHAGAGRRPGARDGGGQRAGGGDGRLGRAGARGPADRGRAARGGGLVAGGRAPADRGRDSRDGRDGRPGARCPGDRPWLTGSS